MIVKSKTNIFPKDKDNIGPHGNQHHVGRRNIIVLCMCPMQRMVKVCVPARLGKGQGAKEIGHNLAREQAKFGHNLVRK